MTESLTLKARPGNRTLLGATVDGDLAAWAGARYELGDNNGSMLYPSMMFRLNGIDPKQAGEAWRTMAVSFW